MFSSFKITIILGSIIAAMSGIGYFGYKYLSTQNEFLREKVSEMESVVNQQNETLDTIEENFESLKQAQNKLSSNFQKIENETSRLERLFSDHDFRKLVENKPGLIENRVNSGTKRVLNDLSNITNPQNFEDENE